MVKSHMKFRSLLARQVGHSTAQRGGTCVWRSSWKGWEENQVSGFVIVLSVHFHSDYLLLLVFRKGNLRSALDLEAWWLG